MADGALLYDGAVLRHLGPSAAYIFRHIDDVDTEDELAHRVSAAVPQHDSVEQDVRDFVRHLRDLGVLRTVALGDESLYVRASGTGWAEDGECILLINLKNGRRAALAGPGARIWRLILEVHSATEVAAEMRGEFPVGSSDVPEGISGLLRNLVEAGFLYRQPSEDSP